MVPKWRLQISLCIPLKSTEKQALLHFLPYIEHWRMFMGIIWTDLIIPIDLYDLESRIFHLNAHLVTGRDMDILLALERPSFIASLPVKESVSKVDLIHLDSKRFQDTNPKPLPDPKPAKLTGIDSRVSSEHEKSTRLQNPEDLLHGLEPVLLSRYLCQSLIGK